MHKCGTSVNNGLLRHNEEKLNSKKQHLKQRDGIDTVHKWNHVFFLIPFSSLKILNRNQTTRPACAVFLYLIQSEFQTLGKHVVVAACLIATVELLVSSAAFRPLSHIFRIQQEKSSSRGLAIAGPSLS